MTLNKIAHMFLVVFSALSILALIGLMFFVEGKTPRLVNGILIASHLYLIYLLIQNRRITWHFMAINIWIVLFSSIGLMYLLPGLYDTESGRMCTGFFGSQISCIESAELSIALLLYNPLIAFSTAIASVASLIFQATGQYPISKSK